MKVVYAYENLRENVVYPTIFLAGPTPRTQYVRSWRSDAVLLMAEEKGTLFVPEPRGFEPFDEAKQVPWEWDALALAQHILFWVPRDLGKLPGFTTNVEFGYWVARNYLKVTLAYPKGAPKMDYLHKLADKHEIPVYHALDLALMSILERAGDGQGNG